MTLREVSAADLPVFFEHQRDPVAVEMAAFPSRDLDAFNAHWAKVLTDPTTLPRTVVADGLVAGNIGSWVFEGHREVGYWIGREFWGRGIASSALQVFLGIDPIRPMHAGVVEHNVGSAKVLAKCGFRPDGTDGAYALFALSC